MEVPDEALAWAAELALELRRRVKEQQAFIGAAEFGKVDLSYRVGDGPRRSSTATSRCSTGCGPRASATRSRERSGDSEVLPEPDPAEVKSSVGAKAADYAVGDVIDGRFEILDVLGQGGFSKVYRVRDDVEGEERAFKLFDNAAGYDAVRREIGALRKVHHPNVVKVYLGRQDRATATGTSSRSTSTASRSTSTRPASSTCATERRSTSRSTSSTRWSRSIPTRPGSSELDRKKRDGELSEAEYRRVAWSCRTRGSSIATSSR